MPESSNSSRKVAFTLTAPQAQSVQLVGDFSGWQEKPVTLKKQKSGVWKATVALPPGRHEYQFIVDGAWLTDPGCAERVGNPYGGENSLRIVT